MSPIGDEVKRMDKQEYLEKFLEALLEELRKAGSVKA